MHETSAFHIQSHDIKSLHPVLEFSPLLGCQQQELDQLRSSFLQCQKWELLPSKSFLRITLKIRIYSKNASVENPLLDSYGTVWNIAGKGLGYQKLPVHCTGSLPQTWKYTSTSTTHSPIEG